MLSTLKVFKNWNQLENDNNNDAAKIKSWQTSRSLSLSRSLSKKKEIILPQDLEVYQSPDKLTMIVSKFCDYLHRLKRKRKKLWVRRQLWTDKALPCDKLVLIWSLAFFCLISNVKLVSDSGICIKFYFMWLAPVYSFMLSATLMIIIIITFALNAPVFFSFNSVFKQSWTLNLLLPFLLLLTDATYVWWDSSHQNLIKTSFYSGEMAKPKKFTFHRIKDLKQTLWSPGLPPLKCRSEFIRFDNKKIFTPLLGVRSYRYNWEQNCFWLSKQNFTCLFCLEKNVSVFSLALFCHITNEDDFLLQNELAFHYH